MAIPKDAKGQFRKKWTYDEKMNACNYYVVTGGSSMEISKLTGVPAQTLRGWTHTQEWAEMRQEIVRRHQDRLDGKFTKIILKGLAEFEDRLEHGDEIWNARDGEMVRRKMCGKDVMMSVDKVIDKRALLRGDPTSRRVSTTVEKQMEDIQSKLEQRTKDMRKQVETSENVKEIKNGSK